MKIKRKRGGDGVFTVRIEAWERAVLEGLLPQLRELLLVGDDTLTRRLYPAAYPQDAVADTAYRQLVHDQLLERRLAAIDTVEANLGAGILTLAELEQWMDAVNSLRLVLGTRLDVSEDDDPSLLDPDDPSLPLWQAYQILSMLLSDLIDAVS